MGAKETFVTIRESADGIGKLKDIRNGQAEIEFFESPAGPRVTRKQASIRMVEGVELSSQTRVFVFDPEHAVWRAGRAGNLLSAEAAQGAEEHYLVYFPNGEKEQVPISRLFVRWGRAIDDPTEYLAAKVTDTPFFFEGRSRIVRQFARQRAAFGGMTALASSGIELLEHQVSLVRKVLADPIQRYLLADEVGLGKTIEAGILLKQHLLDQPFDSSVLVVVPDHLTTQWKQELSAKFGISPLDSRLRVLAMSRWSEVDLDPDRTLIVIDEAHLLAKWAFSDKAEDRRAFANAQQQAVASPRLLLLSGTPVLYQELEFLSMLNLLDPSGYPLNDLDGFRIRVAERQTVAEALVDLTDRASTGFVNDAIGRLRPLFPNDQRLEELSSRVLSLIWSDEDDPSRIAAIRALRIHIREIYKLHRRLLRTRRVDSRIAEHLLSRSGAETIEYDDLARVESASFLDVWRQSLPMDALVRESCKALFALLVSGAFEHPRVLVRLLELRLALLGKGLPRNEQTPNIDLLGQAELFPNEIALLEARKELILSVSEEDERQQALTGWLVRRSEIRRVVLFASDPEIADILAAKLRASLSEVLVCRFSGKLADIADFHATKLRSVLVCDRSAEEGLNLQRSGATVIHFDLPLDVLRIEQRIGRLDRIEAIGKLRNVVFRGNFPFESEWLDCLVSGAGVFSRSVSALQYLLAISRGRIEEDLLDEGRTAFNLELERLLDSNGGVASEIRKIEAQEEMDSVEVDSEEEHAFYTRLLEIDDAVQADGQASLDAWIVRRLHFRHQRLEPGIGRYVYVADETLVPLFDAYRIFRDSLDTDPTVHRRRHELPLLPSTFDRAVAGQKGVGLLRVGNEMLSALERFVRKDDRGAAFAYWRYLPGYEGIADYFFRFDFFVEAYPAQADLEALPGGEDNAAIFQRRADAAFPVQYRTIWLNSDLEPVSDPTILGQLRLGYSKQTRPDSSFDRNLNSERWRVAELRLNFGDWKSRCELARAEAERVLRLSMTFANSCSSSLSRFEAALAERTQIFDSRLRRLSGALRNAELDAFGAEEEFDLSIMAAVKFPTVRVDSVGIVVLASAPLAESSSQGGLDAAI
jgi:ATP-dependent helicase HepA